MYQLYCIKLSSLSTGMSVFKCNFARFIWGAPEFTDDFQWSSCSQSLIFSQCFVDHRLYFRPLSLAIPLSVLQFTASDYPFCIFERFVSRRYFLSSITDKTLLVLDYKIGTAACPTQAPEFICFVSVLLIVLLSVLFVIVRNVACFS